MSKLFFVSVGIGRGLTLNYSIKHSSNGDYVGREITGVICSHAVTILLPASWEKHEVTDDSHVWLGNQYGKTRYSVEKAPVFSLEDMRDTLLTLGYGESPKILPFLIGTGTISLSDILLSDWETEELNRIQDKLLEGFAVHLGLLSQVYYSTNPQGLAIGRNSYRASAGFKKITIPQSGYCSVVHRTPNAVQNEGIPRLFIETQNWAISTQKPTLVEQCGKLIVRDAQPRKEKLQVLEYVEKSPYSDTMLYRNLSCGGFAYVSSKNIFSVSSEERLKYADGNLLLHSQKTFMECKDKFSWEDLFAFEEAAALVGKKLHEYEIRACLEAVSESRLDYEMCFCKWYETWKALRSITPSCTK